MKSKEEIIHEMCLDYRHDYGLRKLDTDPTWTSGMTERDAKMLYTVMEQIYNQVVEPRLKEINDRPKVRNNTRRPK
jgi:predicted ATPase